MKTTKTMSTKNTTPGLEVQLDHAFRRGCTQAMEEAQQIVAETLGGKKHKQADVPSD